MSVWLWVLVLSTGSLLVLDFSQAVIRRRRERIQKRLMPSWEKAMREEQDYMIVCKNGNVIRRSHETSKCNCPECDRDHPVQYIERIVN